MTPIQELTNIYKSFIGLNQQKAKDNFWITFLQLVDIDIDDAMFVQEIYEARVTALSQVQTDIQNMVNEAYQVAKLRKPVDLKRFLLDQKSMYWGFLFQPPRLTDTSFERRAFINAVFLDWEPNKYVIQICGDLDKKFENFNG